MLRVCFFIIFSISCLLYANEDSWQSFGGPQGVEATDLFVTNSGRIFCGTEYQGAYYSDNNGDNWEKVNFNDDYGAISIFLEHPDGSLIAGSDRGFLKSENNGITWELVYQAYLNHLNEFIADSLGNLYYIDYGEKNVYKSSDKGYTWNIIWENQNYIIESISINYNDEIYLALREDGKVYKSIDYGSSWGEFTLPFSLQNDSYVGQILSTKIGFTYFKINWGNNGIYCYDEKNKSATLINQGSIYNLMLGFDLSNNIMMNSGNSLFLYNPQTKSTNYLSSPYFVINQMGKDAIWLSDNECIINYTSMGLFKSKNVGKTWEETNSGLGYRPCFAIEKLYSNEMLAASFSRTFWGNLNISVDGKIWKKIQPSKHYRYVLDISTMSNGNIIAGSVGGILISSDNGKSWYDVDGIDLVYSQYVSNEGTIYVGNSYKGIYRSTNNGRTWASANNGINHEYFFAFGESNTGRIFAGSWPSGVYYSDDAGITWQYLADSKISNSRLYDVKANKDTLYAGTSNGIYKSFNNGLTWNRLNGVYGKIYKIYISPTNDILVSNWGKGIFHSSDYGNTWKSMNENLNNLYVREFLLDDNNILYIATNEGIYFNNFINNYYESIELSKQPNFKISNSFPNPFNSKLSISCFFKIDFNGELRIFDLLGKLVYKMPIISNQPLTLEWNARNQKNIEISSGFYIIQLFDYYSKSVSVAKKVMFIK
jgi:photosystem II stability/assembly factor-like uncharacterized protein